MIDRSTSSQTRYCICLRLRWGIPSKRIGVRVCRSPGFHFLGSCTNLAHTSPVARKFHDFICQTWSPHDTRIPSIHFGLVATGQVFVLEPISTAAHAALLGLERLRFCHGQRIGVFPFDAVPTPMFELAARRVKAHGLREVKRR